MQTQSKPIRSLEKCSLARAMSPILFALIFLTAGCTVGPDYEQPQTDVPDVWKYKVVAEMEDDDSPLQGWWLNLNDPVVPKLIDQALEANYDLKIAVQRVQEARALLGVATGRYYPELDLDARYQKSELSENGVTPVPPGTDQRFGVYDVNVGLAWEIDVFGRLRRSAEAARATLEASIEDYRDVLVILIADVAANYVDVRTF
ncbi:MAG: TolC family protein, partial [Acidobacteriota bacterium]